MSLISISNCRVCNADFLPEPLLVLDNMPAAAQNFPDAENVESDCGANLTLFQCSGCGLVQLGNAPVPYYRDVIRAAGYSEEMGAFRRTQFEEIVATLKLKNKKVLELGCGKGEYLELMRQAGVDAYGIEHDESAVSHCHDQGLNVFQGYPEEPDMQLEHAPYDGFFILNFFEHLPDPNTALRVLARNLAEDGVGLIEVPNFDAILDKKLFSEFINDHLFYFTKDTLVSTLQMNGFEVLSSKSVWYDYILSVTVKKRPALDLGSLGEYQKKIAAELNQYLDATKATRPAIWGAGHQALAVLALAKLGERISLVLDSAPFKQDRFTPATHIPIKDPSVIDDEAVDLLIVMAASYSDEVLRQIEQRHPAGNGKLKHVAVLRDHGLEIIRG